MRALGLIPTEAQIAKYGFKDKPSELYFLFSRQYYKSQNLTSPNDLNDSTVLYLHLLFNPKQLFFPLSAERISFETFLPIYQGLMKEKKPNNPEEFIEGFRVFDKEANGFISAAELRHLLTQLGERLRKEEVDALLAGMEDGQGQVPYEGVLRCIIARATIRFLRQIAFI